MTSLTFSEKSPLGSVAVFYGHHIEKWP